MFLIKDFDRKCPIYDLIFFQSDEFLMTYANVISLNFASFSFILELCVLKQKLKT